ncbi:HD-GYP domain-containing protein [Chitinibacter tainanensis]|uniref:HD-GYP domain-containing protein n=1 Tax=Chitinibacter tainanensis TaxID=230667 RepID=UPI0023521551|nr:HD-GYP domain-containing protein [Chitinibacter tainanensis]
MLFLGKTKAELSRLREQWEAQQRALLASLLASAWVVEARDAYTGGHLWRVAMLSAQLARALGLDAVEVNRIAMAGFLHDLGKIGVPDAILRKPDKLTDDEYAVIKTHPALGARLLAQHPFAPLVLKGVLEHHETPDGRGYPAGLQGEQISLDARIIGVCDAFDAMTSSRPYRAGMPIERALNIIEAALGQQFDRQCGTVLLTLGQAGELAHIVGHSSAGIPLGQCQMCGPTLVQFHSSVAGDYLACPHCQGEYQWQATPQGHLIAQATGRTASAEALALQADTVHIEQLVRQWENVLTTLG